MTKNATNSVTQHNAKCQNYAHDAECHYVECRGAFKGSFPIENPCMDDLKLSDLMIVRTVFTSLVIFFVAHKRAL